MASFYIRRISTLSQSFHLEPVPASRIIRHDEVGKPALGDVMEEILLPNICQFTVIRWYLGQYSLCGWYAILQRQL